MATTAQDGLQYARRKSPRSQGYDYSAAGHYSLVLCTHRRKKLFGHVHNYEMVHSPIGEIAVNELSRLDRRLTDVAIDQFIVMPDHIHVIVVLAKDGTRTIASTIGAYKSAVSYSVAKQFGIREIWQRSYYDHVLRNEEDLLRHREYIQNNPAQLGVDQFEEARWMRFLETGALD